MTKMVVLLPFIRQPLELQTVGDIKIIRMSTKGFHEWTFVPLVLPYTLQVDDQPAVLSYSSHRCGYWYETPLPACQPTGSKYA